MNQKAGRRKRNQSTLKRGEAFQHLVAEVVRSFNDRARITVGEWVDGPDGRREMDVSIRGTLHGKPTLVLIECKDYTYAATARPVGIGDIDALESKRRDLRANYAVIASNSGFAGPALSKASRTGIAAISVLKEGDARAKAQILHSLILRRIFFEGGQTTYRGVGNDRLQIHDRQSGIVQVEGESVDEWLLNQALAFQIEHPWSAKWVRGEFRFRVPVTATYGNQTFTLGGISINARWRTEWLRQVIHVDAGIAVVDYLARRIIFPPGEQRIILRDVDLDTAVLSEPPAPHEYELQFRESEELAMQLCMVVGLPRMQSHHPSRISDAIVQEEMSAHWAEVEPSVLSKSQAELL